MQAACHAIVTAFRGEQFTLKNNSPMPRELQDSGKKVVDFQGGQMSFREKIVPNEGKYIFSQNEYIIYTLEKSISAFWAT
jgi:hypothetical protein